MQAIIGILIFSGAFAVALGVMVMTIAPQWRRILRLASGQPDIVFMPLSALVHAERRIAVRRWAAAPVPVAIRHWHEAA